MFEGVNLGKLHKTVPDIAIDVVRQRRIPEQQDGSVGKTGGQYDLERKALTGSDGDQVAEKGNRVGQEEEGYRFPKVPE